MRRPQTATVDRSHATLFFPHTGRGMGVSAWGVLTGRAVFSCLLKVSSVRPDCEGYRYQGARHPPPSPQSLCSRADSCYRTSGCVSSTTMGQGLRSQGERDGGATISPPLGGRRGQRKGNIGIPQWLGQASVFWQRCQELSLRRGFKASLIRECRL